ncbi:MAG: hypothetical protein ACRENH_10030 [Gemmatimonadaceae bacterium]
MRLTRLVAALVKLALVYFAARGVLTLFGVTSNWLPLGIAIVALVVGRFFVVRAFLRGVRQLVLSKSDALRDATVMVNGVVPAAPPSDYTTSKRSAAAPLFYWIDVTIVPRVADALWDADDMVLVDAVAAAPKREPEAYETKHDVAHVHDIECHAGDRFIVVESNKLRGRQRVRFLMAVEKRSPRVRLKYYFEHLEPAFDLPPHQVSAAA